MSCRTAMPINKRRDRHMAKYRIRIVQVFKTVRSIELDVEADDENDALERVFSGAIDTPDFEDRRWKNHLGPPERGSGTCTKVSFDPGRLARAILRAI
jgi:hypothetical protein